MPNAPAKLRMTNLAEKHGITFFLLNCFAVMAIPNDPLLENVVLKRLMTWPLSRTTSQPL